MKRTYALAALAGSVVLFGSLLISAPAFAQTPPQGGWQGQGNWQGHQGQMPGVFGTVSAINGTTLTVTSKGFGPNAQSATYSVDASNATVTKNGSASSLSDVSIGDTVMVQGTVSGTSVTATAIRDGMFGGMRGHMGHMGSTTPQGNFPQGNGEPVVGGTVTAISGTTVTITNASNVTYTIDASSATVTLKGATSSVSNIAVGDRLFVQGSVNGSTVTASSIIDQGAATTSASPSSTPAPQNHGFMGSILGGIGSFFEHLFGFF